VITLGIMVVKKIFPYFIINVTIYGSLWISSFIHNITLERYCKGSSNGGPHMEPIRGFETIKGKIGYNSK